MIINYNKEKQKVIKDNYKYIYIYIYSFICVRSKKEHSENESIGQIIVLTSFTKCK